jgi:acyl carrier protein
MNKDEMKKQIHDYVFNNTFINKEKIKVDTLIFKEGFLDSMGLVSLITFLEDTFKIQTSDQDLIEQNFESINAIHQFVIKKLNA